MDTTMSETCPGTHRASQSRAQLKLSSRRPAILNSASPSDSHVLIASMGSDCGFDAAAAKANADQKGQEQPDGKAFQEK